jgi:hypothetical protein
LYTINDRKKQQKTKVPRFRTVRGAGVRESVMFARNTWIYIVVVMLMAVHAACSDRKPDAVPAVLVGVEPVVAKIGAADYREVLRSWHRNGYRSRTVIQVGTHVGLAAIPDARLRSIREDVQGADDASRAAERVTGQDYLSAAAELGMVKKLYWVMPFDDLDFINAEVRVQERLRSSPAGLPLRDIESLKFRNGCVSGRLSGIETSICSIASLPSIPEPVLLAVDSGFFPALAAAKRKNILGQMRGFLESLSVRGIRADSVQVVSAPDGSARQGYVPEEVISMLNEPGIIRQPFPPGQWSLRDEADNLLSGGGVRETLQLFRQRGHEYPDDPYLVLTQGTAELLAGVRAEGVKRMERGCRDRELYCQGLVDAGRALEQAGNRAQAARVFARVLELRPDYRPARNEQERLNGRPTAP